MVSAMSTSSACGTGYLAYRTSTSTTCSASCPAARAFHSARFVIRYVWMCSGARSSSANGASACRASAASGASTSSRTVLSDWTISGPSGTSTSLCLLLFKGRWRHRHSWTTDRPDRTRVVARVRPGLERSVDRRSHPKVVRDVLHPAAAHVRTIEHTVLPLLLFVRQHVNRISRIASSRFQRVTALLILEHRQCGDAGHREGAPLAALLVVGGQVAAGEQQGVDDACARTPFEVHVADLD